jgi:hypothetical protein
MIGSKIEAIVKEPNENGDIHISTCIDDDLTHEEMLAAAGSIISDFVKMADGDLDIEDFVRLIRIIYYSNF